MSTDLISVCIPSYNRPALVSEAVRSCFSNMYRPIEILIGDDSSNDESQRLINRIAPPEGITIRYKKRRTRLRQHANVNSLFDATRGKRLVLLHDDDKLLPGAIDALSTAWSRSNDLVAVFGKHRKINIGGRFLVNESEEAARKHFRTSEYAGIQRSNIVSALTGQFWYGYMVEASAAKRARYPEHNGDNGDYEFGVQLAMRYPESHFYYLDEYVVDYRQSHDAISLTSMAASHTVQFLLALELNGDNRAVRDQMLQRLCPTAIPQMARRGQQRQALKLFMSQHYRVPRYSPKGVFHLACIAWPNLGTARSRFVAERRRRVRMRTDTSFSEQVQSSAL